MEQSRTTLIVSALSILASGVVWGRTASVSAVTFIGSSGNLSASADFSLVGNTLTVTLVNTSSHDVLVPTDVLTAVWFDVTHTLTPNSANPNGSSLYCGSLTNVGNGWGYYSGLDGGGQGKNDGITAVGFGVGVAISLRRITVLAESEARTSTYNYFIAHSGCLSNSVRSPVRSKVLEVGVPVRNGVKSMETVGTLSKVCRNRMRSSSVLPK